MGASISTVPAGYAMRLQKEEHPNVRPVPEEAVLDHAPSDETFEEEFPDDEEEGTTGREPSLIKGVVLPGSMRLVETQGNAPLERLISELRLDEHTEEELQLFLWDSLHELYLASIHEKRTSVAALLRRVVALLRHCPQLQVEFLCKEISLEESLLFCVLSAGDYRAFSSPLLAGSSIHEGWWEFLDVVLCSLISREALVGHLSWSDPQSCPYALKYFGLAFLCTTWCPVEIIRPLLSFLNIASKSCPALVSDALRFACLCQGSERSSEFLESVLRRLSPSSDPFLQEKPDWISECLNSFDKLNVVLVRPQDFVDGEIGGLTNRPLVLKKLQFQARVSRLCYSMKSLWHVLPVTIPQSLPNFSKEMRLKKLLRCRELKKQASSPLAKKTFVQDANREIASHMLAVDAEYLTLMNDRKMFSETKSFADAAKAYDKALPSAQLFQAARNVWACYALQVSFFHASAQLNGGILGYSMLYPYSDNYLDDEKIDSSEKREFQGTFRRWLSGYETPSPKTSNERKIFEMVGRVEEEFPRDKHVDVFNSLVAIQDAQTASLRQHTKKGEPLPPRSLILDLTVEKGGTSVLADAYVVHGDGVTPEGMVFAFSFGVALQLVDDLQDVTGDYRSLQHTVFTTAMVQGEAADLYANKLLHMLDTFIHPRHHSIANPTSAWTREQMLHLCASIVLKSIIKSKHMFTPQYVAAMEEYAPLPFSSLVKVNSMRHLLELVRQGHI